MEKTKRYFPRERAKTQGIQSLADYELLAMILRTGKQGTDVLDCARNVLQRFSDIEQLEYATLQQLKEVDGVGESKAMSILAALELGKRTQKNRMTKDIVAIASPQDCVAFFETDMQQHYQECFLGLFLNAKHQVIAQKEIYRGGLHNINVHPREIFRAAVSVSAAAIILLHNHPSGDSRPSQADILTTEALVEAAQIIGIPVLEHIIIGNQNYTSMKEANLVYFDGSEK